jgi:hypothetical protein
MQDTYVSNECEIICEDNGRKMVVEVIAFQKKKYLTVSVDRSLKLSLNWNGRVYEGNMSQLSFVSNGPEITTITKRRR